MATRTVRDEMKPDAVAIRQIRTAKPEEGEAKGEVMHLLRALLLVVAATAVFGWLLS